MGLGWESDNSFLQILTLFKRSSLHRGVGPTLWLLLLNIEHSQSDHVARLLCILQGWHSNDVTSQLAQSVSDRLWELLLQRSWSRCIDFHVSVPLSSPRHWRITVTVLSCIHLAATFQWKTSSECVTMTSIYITGTVKMFEVEEWVKMGSGRSVDPHSLYYLYDLVPFYLLSYEFFFF